MTYVIEEVVTEVRRVICDRCGKKADQHHPGVSFAEYIANLARDGWLLERRPILGTDVGKALCADCVYREAADHLVNPHNLR